MVQQCSIRAELRVYRILEMEASYSYSLIVAWQVAECEAKQLAAAFLEPAHLLLGLCKCVDIDFATSLPQELADRETVLRELVREFEKIATVFRIGRFDARRFRRSYRLVLPKGSAGLNSPNARLHRSGPARDIMREAEAVAKRFSSVVYPTHLLSALLADPDDQRHSTIAKVGADEDQLRVAIEKYLSEHSSMIFKPPELGAASWN